MSRFFFICITIYWGKETHSLYQGIHYIEVHYNEVPLFLLYGEGGVQGFFFSEGFDISFWRNFTLPLSVNLLIYH